MQKPVPFAGGEAKAVVEMYMASVEGLRHRAPAPKTSPPALAAQSCKPLCHLLVNWGDHPFYLMPTFFFEQWGWPCSLN